MEKFLSCDWGVSSLRLRIVETPGLAIIGEEKNNQGIAKTFEWWKQSGKAEKHRAAFYLDIVADRVKSLEKETESCLNKLPLIISGMASSSLGIIDLPYTSMPFSADGSDLETTVIEPHNFFDKIIIISGAKTDHAVMRGEETQLAGCFRATTSETVFVFPGTHSKHVLVRSGKATDIKTYMTGEFFELLTRKSILAASVEESDDFHFKKNVQSFREGVNDSMQRSLLESCFQVRVNDLFGNLTRRQNYFYLSGLLIGTEMNEVVNQRHQTMALVANKKISPYYESAFKQLHGQGVTFEMHNADAAVVTGQYRVYERVCGK